MKLNDAKKLHDREVCRQAAYMKGRVRDLAHKLTSADVSDDVGADILARNIDYMGRTVGRRAQGAFVPTQGYVCVDGDFRRRVAQGPTYKVKDHKAHKQLRVAECARKHANSIDASRRFAYITAPFRKGGIVYAKVSKCKRNRFRAILHKADGFARKGEIAVALELAKAL